jgi:general secretion pathway protein E
MTYSHRPHRLQPGLDVTPAAGEQTPKGSRPVKIDISIEDQTHKAPSGEGSIEGASTGDERTEDTPATSLDPDLVSDAFIQLIPRDFARAHLFLSQGRIDGVERVAISESTDPLAVHNAATRMGMKFETFRAEGEAIACLIDQVYGEIESQHAPDDDVRPTDRDQIDRLLAEADRDLLSTQGKGPVVKLVDALLLEALSRKASDVHVQPLADRTLVRYRLDGVLHTARELPRTVTSAVISRIKVMGRMDIAERRVPQDGRASVTIGTPAPGITPETPPTGGDYSGGGRSVDLRISTLPTSYGERAVIRLLDSAGYLCDFNRLGMPQDVAEKYLAHARKTNGIMLLTGPTGSGKTTTLYATLRCIGSVDVNVMTIEDPIEYELSSSGLAISQSQINTKKGVTFASGLRHLLRQDPDIVMVGEIRDLETARIAIQSSLTGHLVLSTLHTNDAAGAVMRLIDLGIEPYLVSASLSAVMAQRLVRLLHQPCAGAGCEACFSTGYSGRRGLFELLSVDETIRALINRGAAVSAIRDAAVASGMRLLREQGRRLVKEGLTSRLEVERVVHAVI